MEQVNQTGVNMIDEGVLLKQGAEGRIFLSTFKGTPCIVKERFAKMYRHPTLDKQLTKARIRAECKAIKACAAAGIKTPAVYASDLDRRTIHLEFIPFSIMAKEFIENSTDAQLKWISKEIGTAIAKMHSNKIVHGDLTTSNILVQNNKQEESYTSNDQLEVVFIDFGLAQLEASAEDKGVDLYVLERALLSTHSVAEVIFPDILEAYKATYEGSADVIKKFEEVRARGRKRTMVG